MREQINAFIENCFPSAKEPSLLHIVNSEDWPL